MREVRIGAKLLDRLYPGWAYEIDLDRLDLLDPRQCILGQLVRNDGDGTSGFDRVHHRILDSGLSSQGFMMRNGFNAHFVGTYDGRWRSAWGAEIEARLR